LGFAISKQEYRAHGSAILLLWGVLFLIDAPLQHYVPQFLVIGIVGISVSMLVLLPLMLVYTLWIVKELNYLSISRTIAVFILSIFTLPIYYLVTSFIFALPFFILFPMIYLGYQWMRDYVASQSGERSFQQNLHTLTMNPQDADAHYQLGLIHFRRRNLDVARRYFENALKIDPVDPEFHYFLGRTWEYQGDWARALEQYEETYRLNSEYGLGDVFREVGKGYLNTGSVEKGIEFLNFFLGRRDSDPEGRYWLAVAMQRSGKLDQMRLQLKLILEQANANPRFFRRENREWIYKARSLLREAGNQPDANGR
jgi:tetratricopeptide (TPR) repeat protein